jgi:hypothetical protein
MIVQILSKNKESLATSNSALLQDNTLLHYKIEQTNKLIDRVAQEINELHVKASLISSNASR